MNKEAMIRWVEALLSGKYKQGKGALHIKRKDGDEFCCLGVACHIFEHEAGLTTHQGDWIGLGDTLYYKSKETNLGSSTRLPRELQKYLGLESTEPTVNIDGVGFSLSALNDDPQNRYDFVRIAKAINNHFELGLEIV